jgi:hypothetical protein
MNDIDLIKQEKKIQSPDKIDKSISFSQEETTSEQNYTMEFI